MRVTLHSAKLPIATFWVNAARDVVHKSNLIPREALNWDTPWELVMGRWTFKKKKMVYKDELFWPIEIGSGSRPISINHNWPAALQATERHSQS